MKKIFLPGLIFLTFLSSCTSTKIISSWNGGDSTATVQNIHYNRILVVGIFNATQRNMRQQIESQFVSNLQAAHFSAIGSFATFGPHSFENMSEDSALKKIGNDAADAIVTIQLIDQSRQKTFVPGPRYYNPYSFYRPYGYGYNPYGGRYQVSTNLVFETNVYDVKNKRLIYSSEAQDSDAGNIATIADNFTRAVIKDLRKNNVLG